MNLDLPQTLIGDIHNQLLEHDLLFQVQALGDMRGTVATLAFDKSCVANLLPQNDLELMDQTVTEKGKHPVLLFFCRQRKVHFDIEDEIDLMDLNYNEAILAVPYVRWRRDEYPYRGPFAYMPILCLDRLVPIGMGRLVAYNKQLAEINRIKYQAYEVERSLAGPSMLSGRFQERTEWDRPASFDQFESMKRMLNQPLVGNYIPEHPGQVVSFSFYVCTHLRFRLKKASMRAVDAEIAVADNFCGDLGGDYCVTYDAAKPLQAVQFKARWSLRPPRFPEYFSLRDPDERGVYKPAERRSFASRLATAAQAAAEVNIGVASGVARGISDVRDRILPDLRLSADKGLLGGIIDGGASLLDEIAIGFRRAQDRLSERQEPARSEAAASSSRRDAVRKPRQRRRRRKWA